MGYAVIFQRAAQKALAGLPSPVRENIALAISRLSSNPRMPGVKRLTNSPYHRARVGSYRIIYEIKDAELIVLVIRIADRKEVYRSGQP